MNWEQVVAQTEANIAALPDAERRMVGEFARLMRERMRDEKFGGHYGLAIILVAAETVVATP